MKNYQYRLNLIDIILFIEQNFFSKMKWFAKISNTQANNSIKIDMKLMKGCLDS